MIYWRDLVGLGFRGNPNRKKMQVGLHPADRRSSVSRSDTNARQSSALLEASALHDGMF
jgi:hypothetical protein